MSKECEWISDVFTCIQHLQAGKIGTFESNCPRQHFNKILSGEENNTKILFDIVAHWLPLTIDFFSSYCTLSVGNMVLQFQHDGKWLSYSLCHFISVHMKTTSWSLLLYWDVVCVCARVCACMSQGVIGVKQMVFSIINVFCVYLLC